MSDNKELELAVEPTAGETTPVPVEYMQVPRPGVRLACGNCGSNKLIVKTVEGQDFKMAECENCSKLFAICPSCALPVGLEGKEMGEDSRFWKCPNCQINFTLISSANTYLTAFKNIPETNNYPYGNPEVTYDTKGGQSMDNLTENLYKVPVGEISSKTDEPNIPLELRAEIEEPVRKRRRTKAAEVETKED